MVTFLKLKKMEEIKFRAWNEVKKEMHTEFQFISSGSDGNDWILFHSKEKPVKRTKEGLLFDDPFFRHQMKLMQFTGIKDKNGKEIYAGDIIRNSQADYNKVIWFYDSWCYKNYHAEALPLGDHGNPYVNDGLSDHEVIGNIYQNPEMIQYLDL